MPFREIKILLAYLDLLDLDSFLTMKLWMMMKQMQLCLVAVNTLAAPVDFHGSTLVLELSSFLLQCQHLTSSNGLLAINATSA